jgi:hypothetical protein
MPWSPFKQSSESGRRVLCVRALERERVRCSPLYCGGAPHARSEWLMATFSAAPLPNMHYAKSARVHVAARPVWVCYAVSPPLALCVEWGINPRPLSGRNPSKSNSPGAIYCGSRRRWTRAHLILKSENVMRPRMWIIALDLTTLTPEIWYREGVNFQVQRDWSRDGESLTGSKIEITHLGNNLIAFWDHLCKIGFLVSRRARTNYLIFLNNIILICSHDGDIYNSNHTLDSGIFLTFKYLWSPQRFWRGSELIAFLTWQFFCLDESFKFVAFFERSIKHRILKLIQT